jgi:hypothetical protein
MKPPLLLRAAPFAVVISMAFSAVAGQPPSAAEIRAAAEAFDRGRDAYKQDKYLLAADYFEEADRNAPSAAALELAIRSRDKAGHLDRAATLAALALQRHPNEPSLKKTAEAIVTRAKKDLHEIEVSCDEPCDLAIDTKLVHGTASTKRSIYVTPGTHTLNAGWSDSRSRSQEVIAPQHGATSRVEFTAPPVAAPAEEHASSDAADAALDAEQVSDPRADPGPRDTGSGWSPTVFYVGLGLTAVAGGVTAWSGIDTLNNPGQDAVRKNCAPGDEDCPEYLQGLEHQRRTNILVGVTAGLGVITLIVGAFATDWGGEADTNASSARTKPKQRVGVQPWVTVGAGGNGGAAVGAVGRF